MSVLRGVYRYLPKVVSTTWLTRLTWCHLCHLLGVYHHQVGLLTMGLHRPVYNISLKGCLLIHLLFGAGHFVFVPCVMWVQFLLGLAFLQFFL